MARTKKKAKKAAETTKRGPVLCFVFYGSIDELGAELATFAEKSHIADAITGFVASAQAAASKK